MRLNKDTPRTRVLSSLCSCPAWVGITYSELLNDWVLSILFVFICVFTVRPLQQIH
ncbi:hypothetical protein AHF37_09948 [Paragonimus kellicotti]|nr:hypothetical protein AHF37_09948 [Paragonimus kellicotti]